MSFFRIPIHTTEHTKRCNLKTLTALITADTVAKGNTFKVTHVKKKFTGKKYKNISHKPSAEMAAGLSQF